MKEAGMAAQSISGIHHITAIASDPQRNLDFYTQVLGLRLVKLTVNFDDPGTYHLYFGNRRGAPGSILTFFPWPGARRGTVGNGQVSATAFAARPKALDFWRSRLAENGIAVEDAGVRFGDPVLRFSDPDGMPLELVGTALANPDEAWPVRAVPQPYAICGFHSATLSEEGYERTAALLEQSMGLRFVGSEGNRFRYACAAFDAGDAGAIVDVVCAPDGATGRLGAGTVHHIAWRTADDAQQELWRSTLVQGGYNVSPIMDRMYFHSIYFREPGGVLFEIATDPPGFAADEPFEHLGERLTLPRWLEPQRSAVEQGLPALKLPHNNDGHAG
jgi:glyoxalase family protein